MPTVDTSKSTFTLQEGQVVEIPVTESGVVVVKTIGFDYDPATDGYVITINNDISLKAQPLK